MMDFLAEYGNELLVKTWEHLYISLAAIILGVLVAVPLGIVLSRKPNFADRFISFIGILQTIPSLAILAFFIPIMGVGKVPAIFALFFYSLLPILRNTYIGVRDVDPGVKEAGKGMGMSNWQSIVKMELPLSLPVIMAGIRLSTVYLVGWATLAAFIGGGGLGDFIFDGLNLYQPSLIIAGTIPATILAVIADRSLAFLENRLTPDGLKDSYKTA
ncbi:MULTISPECIES: ABC transporter permease [Virgibacillus]|uniref:Glycine betaine/carnitine/choline transport system permease protein OpuCB n=2 Tax=Virgibacillus TaxID=84406 RepID=A0A024QHF3_9BACI|nr:MULTISPECIES: ABC transporter permease [Virgibacillus]EQB34666.1 choline ABC transporter permease [Virgibacillus sp. CM-4]MYL43676.1 ABC transporter permease subunit [Virgibacillus massiliensis]GGJ63744.1 glycine betaine/carnitine/choline transport system permease protein OpuCB [Virgibacillus kapii]CDQ41630.1 Glycine betaine/carnitine/choline transport system permease protein OpuCB [Virgibacillus massiliensis]